MDQGDFKNNASISIINVYRLSKADLLLKLILRYVINVFLASCQISSLYNVPFKNYKEKCHPNCHKGNTFCDNFSLTFNSTVNCIKHYSCIVKW